MYKTIPVSLRLVTLGVLLCAASASQAQWKWTDAQGRTVYSDRPPPASVPRNKIQQHGFGHQHSGRVAVPAETPSAATKQASASAPELTPEQKKQQAEAEAKAKAEAQRQAQQRADNCKRALQSKATLTSGMRLSTSDASGNRQFMDDATRASELKRVNEIIAADCGK